MSRVRYWTEKAALFQVFILKQIFRRIQLADGQTIFLPFPIICSVLFTRKNTLTTC